MNAHRTVKKSALACSRTQPNASRWCTSLSFSPYDHALYLGQYKVPRHCLRCLLRTHISWLVLAAMTHIPSSLNSSSPDACERCTHITMYGSEWSGSDRDLCPRNDRTRRCYATTVPRCGIQACPHEAALLQRASRLHAGTCSSRGERQHLRCQLSHPILFISRHNNPYTDSTLLLSWQRPEVLHTAVQPRRSIPGRALLRLSGAMGHDGIPQRSRRGAVRLRRRAV